MSAEYDVDHLPERPDTQISVRGAFDDRHRHDDAGLRAARAACAGHRSGLPLRPRHHDGDPLGLRRQSPRRHPGPPRHRQVDAYRAGRRAAELAAGARQPRQPHQPHRPDRQGRHRAARRQAGHRVPRRHPAMGVPAAGGAGLRRVRRRAAGRDVRDPARARGGRAPDHPRPEQGAAAASRRSASSPPPTPSASATPAGSIMARSSSTRRSSTAGTSSPGSTTSPSRRRSMSCSPRCRRWPTMAAARSCCRWCAPRSRRASASRPATSRR